MFVLRGDYTREVGSQTQQKSCFHFVKITPTQPIGRAVVASKATSTVLEVPMFLAKENFLKASQSVAV
jgi:hypothetical protein